MCSDHTAQVMDEDAKNMVDEAYLRTNELMTKYRCACASFDGGGYLFSC